MLFTSLKSKYKLAQFVIVTCIIEHLVLCSL